jgi:hypothetical protein
MSAPGADGTIGADVGAVWDAANAKFQARQVEINGSDQARELRFAVGLGVLAWGLSRHNHYLTIVGAGFLAYDFVKGRL